MGIELRALSTDIDDALHEMAIEIGPGEHGFENGLFALNRTEFRHKLLKYVDMSEGVNLEPQYVPQTIYVLFADNIPVGYGKLRHDLNDKLREHGGHIGYVIRPSYRGKGYGKILLKELVKVARHMQIESVLLTCDENNQASRKVIESNRGELAEIHNGRCKYWIRTGMDSAIMDYYESHAEDQRLSGLSIEKLRSQELIRRHIEDSPLRILDIGGAAGVYSFWLSELGHHVHLLDASPKHVSQAKDHSNQTGILLEETVLGDARNLDYEDDSFDVVLLMGPLYHLTNREERVLALSEARRVLRPGGLIFAAVISRYASMMDGFHLNLIQDPNFVAIMNRDLEDGQHRNFEDKYFTTAFFHTPDELETEMRDAGFESQRLYAVESFAEYIPDLYQKLNDGRSREILCDTLRKIECDRSILGVSPHMMAIGKK